MSDNRGLPPSRDDARLAATVASSRARVARQIGLVVVLGLVGWAVVATMQRPAYDDDAERIDRMTASGCAYDSASDPGSEHVDQPSYTVDPPAGGAHSREPATTGVFDAPSAPTDGSLVHSMEHGLVVVWLGRGISAGDAARARALHEQFPAFVAVVERPSLTAPIAATAWHRRLLCRRADLDAVLGFVCAFHARGPERVQGRTSRGCDDV